MTPNRAASIVLVLFLTSVLTWLLFSQRMCWRTGCTTKLDDPAFYWFGVFVVSFLDILFVIVAILSRVRRDGDL